MMEVAHNTHLADYRSVTAAEKGVTKLIRDPVDKVYYKDLKHPTTYYNNVTAAKLLTHLGTNCRGCTPEDPISLQMAMAHFYAECNSIPEYINKLEEAHKTIARGNQPMPDTQILAIASASVFATHDFVPATEDWGRLTTTAKTWTMWKKMYREARAEQAHLHTA